ncbi:MAG: 6,7-dimethyl-8-ribityllumazine synthase [Candidatus Omnitrophota bacterium]|nr:MAG: 6,7-dimethyl-8-ribityllumazine synthase [Candidatus Omnitrophota bacterium]
MKEIKGNYQGKGKKIAIVVSKFNEFISRNLLEGCQDELKKQGVEEKNIDVVWCPGAFEIPQILAKLISKKYDALIALGALIRGETPHFDFLAPQVTKAVSNLSLNYKIPIALGIITAETIEQAIERAGTKEGNKGREAARVAIEMANIYSQM